MIVSAANGTLGRGVPEETSTALSSAPEVTTAASEPEETAEATPESAEGTSAASSPSEVPESSAPPATSAEAPSPAIPGCEVTPADTALGEDIIATELPDGAVVTAVTENRPDSDVDPSLTWVRVEVCSAGLSAEHHRVVATDIAIAARDAAGGATGSGGSLWLPGRPWTGPSIPNASGASTSRTSRCTPGIAVPQCPPRAPEKRVAAELRR